MIVPRERIATPPQSVQLEKLLLAEGDTPTHLLEAFAKHLDLSSSIEIRNFGGIKQLGAFLKIISSTSAFRAKVKSLGIVRDAEDDPAAARASVDAAIANASLPKEIRTSISILPDSRTQGMIETLCLRSVRSLEYYDCIEKFFDCIESKGVQVPKNIIRDKYFVQVYLTTVGQAQMMPGIAAYKGAWPFDDPAFDSLKAFILGL